MIHNCEIITALSTMFSNKLFVPDTLFTAADD